MLVYLTIPFLPRAYSAVMPTANDAFALEHCKMRLQLIAQFLILVRIGVKEF